MLSATQTLPSTTTNQPIPYIKLVPSYTLHEDDIALCKQYNIPYQKSYSTHKELTVIEELIGDYLDLLEDAKSLGIYWDTSTFNPEGLRKAIDNYHASENNEEIAHFYHREMKNNLWAYYSSLGVL